MNELIVKIFDVPLGLNVLNAGIILGLMAAPIMTTIAEDALKAVPENYREAAEAMGATRWQVIRQVVLPSAKTGLVAAVLLGVGRGFGETMAVLMASGHSINLPTSPLTLCVVSPRPSPRSLGTRYPAAITTEFSLPSGSRYSW